MTTEVAAAPVATVEEVLRALARGAGYLVHTWGAVENGDSADSCFWKRWGSPAGQAESPETFASELEAWRDCCEVNGLLGQYIDAARAHGLQLERAPGFLQWTCRRRGDLAGTQAFAHAADALVDGVLRYGLEPVEVPDELEEISDAPAAL